MATDLACSVLGKAPWYRILHTHNGLFWATSVWWSRRRLWRRCSSAASEWAAPCHGCRHQWVGHHRQHRLVIIAQESSLRFRRLQVKGRVAEDQVQTLITAPSFVRKQAAGPANVLCFHGSCSQRPPRLFNSAATRPSRGISIGFRLWPNQYTHSGQKWVCQTAMCIVQCLTNRTQHTGAALRKQSCARGSFQERMRTGYVIANSNHRRKNMQCTENSARAQLNLGCVWGASLQLVHTPNLRAQDKFSAAGITCSEQSQSKLALFISFALQLHNAQHLCLEIL